MICDVCLGDFEPRDPSQKLCSPKCRWAAGRAAEMARALECCPSGKIRHHTKKQAEKSARSAVRARYRGFRNWLRVYKCDRCFGGWHLTSKPPARRRQAARATHG